MRLLSSFALNISLIAFYLHAIWAHIPTQKDSSAILHTSTLPYHDYMSTLQPIGKYRNEIRQKQENVPPSSRRSLQKRGQSQSRPKKSEQSPPPTPPRIISVGALAAPSLPRTASIPIPGSSSRSRQSASPFQQISGGGSSSGSTPPYRSSSSFPRISGGGSTPGSTSQQRPSSSSQQISGGSSIAGSAPLQRPSSSLLSEAGRRQTKPISKSEPGSSSPQRLSPAVQRASASNALIGPPKSFRRPEPGTYYSTWETSSGPGTPRTSSQRSSRSTPDDTPRASSQRSSRFNPNDPAKLLSQGSSRFNPEINISDSSRHSETVISRPPSQTVPTSVKTGRQDIAANVPQRSDTQKEKSSRGNSLVNLIPPSNPRSTFAQPPIHRIPVGSVFTQPPTNPISADSVFTQPTAGTIPRGGTVPKRLSSPSSPSNTRSISTQPPAQHVPADSIFTQAPRGTSLAHERQSGPSTLSNIKSAKPATSANQPIKAPPPVRVSPSTPPSHESLMRANKATSNFYRNLSNLPKTNNPEQTAKQARWGLLSKVHGLASEFYAQNPNASSDSLSSKTVPAVLESAPNPTQQAAHKTTANFYNRLAQNPTTSAPLSGAQIDELRLLAKYHGAVSKYYAEPT